MNQPKEREKKSSHCLDSGHMELVSHFCDNRYAITCLTS
jgi:hypothetical protein